MKPSKGEQRWAKQMELDLKKELYENLSNEELQDLRELHWQKCPKDGIDLVLVEIDNTDINIGKCLICGGIWIERKDLEKLLQSVKKPEKLIKLLANALDIHVPEY